MTRLYFIALLFVAATRVLALSAIQGSPCYAACNGDAATSPADIVCTDDDFENTPKGQTLSKCQSCLQLSTYKSGWMTDAILFLYYLGTVQQTCLSGKPAEPISDCSSKCSNLSSAFSTLTGRNFFQNPWNFCSANANVYTDDADACAQCLQGQANTVILGNFVHVSNLGCATQPDVASGALFYTTDDLFDTTVQKGGGSGSAFASASASASASKTGAAAASPTNPGSATPTPSDSAATVTTSPPAAAATSSSHYPPTVSTSSSQSAQDDTSGSGGLSRGAAAGIGVVFGLLGTAVIIFIAFLARRRMMAKQSAGAGPWKRMQASPQMQQVPEVNRGATPPAAGVFVAPVPDAAKRSRSFKSIASKSLKSLKMTPRTSEWFSAANPRRSDDLSALPQRGWD